MSLLRQRRRRDPRRRPDPFVRLAAEPFPAGDLCPAPHVRAGPGAATNTPGPQSRTPAGGVRRSTDPASIATGPMLQWHGNHYLLQRFTAWLRPGAGRNTDHRGPVHDRSSTPEEDLAGGLGSAHIVVLPSDFSQPDTPPEGDKPPEGIDQPGARTPRSAGGSHCQSVPKTTTGACALL